MSSPTVLRIASIDCDVPVPNVYAERGFYSDIFSALLKNAAKSELKDIEIDVRVTRYDCLRGELPSSQELKGIDGIIVTGSIAAAYDDMPWIHELVVFLKKIYFHNLRVKIFGSCFGHQLIAHAIFSTPPHNVVCKDPAGREIGVHSTNLTLPFLSHFGPVTSNPGNQKKMRLQLIHADHVVLSPAQLMNEKFENIGGSEHCALQGLWKRDRVLTYQGHAEFDRFVNVETARVFAKGEWTHESIEKEDDAIWAAGVMLRFFLGAEA